MGSLLRKYSEDPDLVQAMTEIIDGLQGEIPPGSPKSVPFVAGKKNVAACAKHYVGDGGTTKGINENNTVIDFHALLRIHIPGYYNAIIKGVSTIMISFSSVNGVKMHANHDLIAGFLKNTLCFKGFVISDWQGIEKVTSPSHANYLYSIQTGIRAEFIDGLTYLVKYNFIPMSRIDDAVKRIFRVKFMLGLFENPLADVSLVASLAVREAVRKSLVLLKNAKSTNEPLLPLSKKTPKILVAGSHANNLGYHCGGWTIQLQGLSGNNLTNGKYRYQFC